MAGQVHTSTTPSTRIWSLDAIRSNRIWYSQMAAVVMACSTRAQLAGLYRSLSVIIPTRLLTWSGSAFRELLIIKRLRKLTLFKKWYFKLAVLLISNKLIHFCLYLQFSKLLLHILLIQFATSRIRKNWSHRGYILHKRFKYMKKKF